jgi:hypothetical protein
LDCNQRKKAIFIELEGDVYSVRREVLYSVLKEIGKPMKYLGQMELCLNGNCINAHIGKQFSDNVLILNNLRTSCFSVTAFQICLRICQ